MKYRTVNSLIIYLWLCSWALVQCEYEVTEPAWYRDYTEPPTPTISVVNPAEAVPGVNYIDIKGSNFVGAIKVYFDNVKADIVSSSKDSIRVRRPNMSKDGCYVKVVCDSALVVAKYGPYKIHPVIERYGNFLENEALSVAAVDTGENLYVVTEARKILKITPGGDKLQLGTALRTIFDAAIGPDNNLYLVSNNRAVDVVNTQAGGISEWKKLNSGKVVKYADFDAQGYFYAGGRRTGVVVVAPNKTETDLTLYASDEITGVRVYQQYLYLSVIYTNPDASHPRLAIWRHALGGNGAVGSAELVLDLTALESYTENKYNSFYFGTDGRLYLGVNATKPLLAIDLTSQTVDYFYLGIIPSYCKFFCWGTRNYLYLIRGDTDLAEEWTIYRIDMGVAAGSKQ